MQESELIPGPIVLMGSGEISTSSGAVFEKVAAGFESPVRFSILETPAGFELNSQRVAGRVADFLQNRLQNFKPEISIIPARQKDTEFSPDHPEILEPLFDANMIFLGPGSPTYTARQLAGSLAYEIIQAKHRTGSALMLSSAATIAFGCQTLPVYEIFKAGMDLHWQPGLDIFKNYGLSLIIIPHWNNNEGGEELDTSRCFMGAKRFDALRDILTCDGRIIGIDEHTSLWIDIAGGTAEVFGKGAVHVFHKDKEWQYQSGEEIALKEFGEFSLPDEPFREIRESVWKKIDEIRERKSRSLRITPPVEILDLVSIRETARMNRSYDESDRIRSEIADKGWIIVDTADGPQLSPK